MIGEVEEQGEVDQGPVHQSGNDRGLRPSPEASFCYRHIAREVSVASKGTKMKIHYLVAIPVTALMVACGGSTPEPETPAAEKAETATPKDKAEEGSETPGQEKAEEKSEKPSEAAPADKK